MFGRAVSDVLPTHIIIPPAHLLSRTLSSSRPRYPCALQSGPGPIAIDPVAFRNIVRAVGMCGVAEVTEVTPCHNRPDCMQLRSMG